MLILISVRRDFKCPLSSCPKYVTILLKMSRLFFLVDYSFLFPRWQFLLELTMGTPCLVVIFKALILSIFELVKLYAPKHSGHLEYAIYSMEYSILIFHGVWKLIKWLFQKNKSSTYSIFWNMEYTRNIPNIKRHNIFFLIWNILGIFHKIQR